MGELATLETAHAGTVHVARVTGELDLSNARELTDALAPAVPADVTLVVLDLSGTRYLDSAAIASLFRLAQRLRDRRQDLRLVVPPDAPIRAVLELTRLTQVITVDEAVPDLPDVGRAYAALPPATAPLAKPREPSGVDGPAAELDGTAGAPAAQWPPGTG